jgi:hypothetical protein
MAVGLGQTKGYMLHFQTKRKASFWLIRVFLAQVIYYCLVSGVDGSSCGFVVANGS